MITLEDKREKDFRDFEDSCRRLGGKFRRTDIEAVCTLPYGDFFLHLPKDALNGHFKFETRTGKKIGVIFDIRTIDII